MFQQLPELSPDDADIKEISELLKKITIPLYSNMMSRALRFGTHRSVCLGDVKDRFKHTVGRSRFSRKYPMLHDAVFRLGNKICPFAPTSCYINHNVVCPPHTDPHNNGESVIVSIGDYRGGDLVIKGQKVSTYMTPFLFDGGKYEHWNTPLDSEYENNKYSLVFFSTK